MATLEDQIRAAWGQYGDWNAAGQDQVSALANLLRSRGVNDLSKLQFKKRKVTDPAFMQQQTEGQQIEVGPQDREVFDAFVGDQALGYLGDINRDGSYGRGAQFVDGQDPAQLGVRGDRLAWSAQGGGNTAFNVVAGPDGKPVVVPTWASSKQDDLTNAKMVAMMAAMAYGGAAMGGTSAGGAGGAASAGGAGAGAGAGTVTLGELGTFSIADLSMGTAMAEGAAGIGAAGAGAGGTMSIGGLGDFSVADMGMGAEMAEGASGIGLSDASASSLLTDAGQELGEKAATETAKDAIDKPPANKPNIPKDGWDTLTKIGGGLITAGLAGDALSDPVDTSRYDQLFDNLLAEQKVASQRGTDLWEDYQNTWKPIQQKFADTAMGYDTPERRESAANAATGVVAEQYDIERTQAQRDLMSAGVDPSTIYALGTASRLDEAKARAAAANNARDNTEKTGLNLLQGAVNQGNTVVNQGVDQSRLVSNNTQAAAGILNNQANLQNQNTQNRNEMIGDLFTGVSTAYGMYTSSEKKKHMGKKVDGLDAAKAVQKSPAKHWQYRDGEGDGNTKARMGPTAESLKKVAPAVSDGKQVDGIAQLGLHHAAIGGIAKRMERIEQKLGLSDARRRA